LPQEQHLPGSPLLCCGRRLRRHRRDGEFLKDAERICLAITGETPSKGARLRGAHIVERAAVRGNIGRRKPGGIIVGAAVRGPTRPDRAAMRARNSPSPGANPAPGGRSGGPAAAIARGAGRGIGVGADTPALGTINRGSAPAEMAGPRAAWSRGRDAGSPLRAPGCRPRSCRQMSVAIPAPG
jgi:hypothetical protein